MTDFVGWLPMPDGGEREAFLTADYNAEMIEHVERFPRIRDRAIFVGEPDDIVPDDFGPGLPAIRDWTEQPLRLQRLYHGLRSDAADRAAAMRSAGSWATGPTSGSSIVTVGGSGVGESLLRRVIASYPEAARRVNGLRMIVGRRAADRSRLARRDAGRRGPRLCPGPVPASRRVRPRGRPGRPHDDDGARGGATSVPVFPATQPLRAEPARPPSARRGTARAGTWTTTRPRRRSSPQAIAEEIDRPVDYRPVESDGAARAAALIAPLI